MVAGVGSDRPDSPSNRFRRRAVDENGSVGSRDALVVSNPFTSGADAPRSDCRRFAWMDGLLSLLGQPMLLLIVGAAVSGWLIPEVTRRWQDQRKAAEIKSDLVEIKSDLVERVTRAVTKSSPQHSSWKLARSRRLKRSLTRTTEHGSSRRSTSMSSCSLPRSRSSPAVPTCLPWSARAGPASKAAPRSRPVAAAVVAVH